MKVRNKTCRGIWATRVTELSNSSHKNRKSAKLQCPADDAIYSPKRLLTISVTKQTPEALFHLQVITNKYTQLTYVLERLSVTLFSIFHFPCSGITTLLHTSRICTHRRSFFRAHIRDKNVLQLAVIRPDVTSNNICLSFPDFVWASHSDLRK